MNDLSLLHEKSLVASQRAMRGAPRLGHRTREDNRRTPVWAMKVDFGQPVSRDVNVGRRVVVLVDSDAEAVGAQDSNYPSA